MFSLRLNPFLRWFGILAVIPSGAKFDRFTSGGVTAPDAQLPTLRRRREANLSNHGQALTFRKDESDV